MTIPYRKKLIEVALPLPEINDASAYDKMPGIGPHPKGIHQWWARLPLPTARAVLFASVVTDPSENPDWMDKGIQEQDAERERLFGIIRRLMQKKLHERPDVYEEARSEMLKHCDGKLPPVLDPFSGGGSIPLEAARLGFEAHAADLNPVAVLLNKCNLELVPRWLNHPPVNPDARKNKLRMNECHGSRGLAEDVRHYGRVVLEQVRKKIGHLYPKVHIIQEEGGSWRHATREEINSGKRSIREAEVIAWLWARTIKSPNPAAKGAHVPLVGSFWLSSKNGTLAWLQPVVDRMSDSWRFEVKTGTPHDRKALKQGTKLGRGAQFRCILTDTPIPEEHVRKEVIAKRCGFALTAIVANIGRGRVYLPADERHFSVATGIAPPSSVPDEDMNEKDPNLISGRGYGIKKWAELFTQRQLTALVTFSELVREVRQDVLKDAQDAGLSSEDAEEYAKAIATFLAMGLDRCADFSNALCRWTAGNQKVMNLFGKQAIPMVWDFAEANLLGDSVGAWSTCSGYVANCIEVIGASGYKNGSVRQVDAASAWDDLRGVLVSTDPPYYANIGYAALSDFFYIWLRRTIGDLAPTLFRTIMVPKEPELVAAPERFDGDREKAREHFETGFRKVFTGLREKMDRRFPLTVYYAYKQEDEEASTDQDEAAEGPAGNGVDLTTGWETLLEALLGSGFQITATWPVRASQQWRMVAMGTNALASYIVLACRPRTGDKRIGRAAFIAELKRVLPSALHHLQQGNVAPVDFAQAAIGPGMAVFSKYSAVLESSGNPMSVRTALALINGIKDELLGEAVEELDKDTRWAMTWFAETGFEFGEAGKANLLANAQATAVNALVNAGIVEVKGNLVRLYRPEELSGDWEPQTDKRLTVWEMTHHLIRVYFHEKKGEVATGDLLRKLGTKAEVARDLAYKLFTVCESRKRSQEAQAYNALVMGWPELSRLAREPAKKTTTRPQLPGME